MWQTLKQYLDSARFFQVLCVLYLLTGIVLLCLTDGTGDAGDSIQHYLIARYAPQHPELFFDHWAKPIYILSACPFAQFGLPGVQVFNLLLSAGSLYLSWKCARHFQFQFAILTPVLLIACPLWWPITLSGLTEPLFAFSCLLVVYLLLKARWAWAVVILSFLPFVRSEGLVLFGPLVIYLLYVKQWKVIPLLLTGHLVYAIAGSFIHGDLLWVFQKMAYNRLDSTYGRGELFHFVGQLIYITGVPVYLFFWIGSLRLGYDLIRKKNDVAFFWLIAGGFFSVFIAHSLFWYFGVFNSMGLKRVLIGVLPLLALIAHFGLAWLFDLRGNKRWFALPGYLLLVYTFIFPFTSNPAAFKHKDFHKRADQLLADQLTPKVRSLQNPNSRLIFNHPYLNVPLQSDPFDSNHRLDLNIDYLLHPQRGDLIIWDNWFSVVEQAISLDALDAMPNLKRVKRVQTTEHGHLFEYVIFKVI